MRATIDTDLKTLLVLGDASEEQIKSFVLAHDLEAFEVKREWPYDQPNCEAILKVMRDAITYEKVEKDGEIGHQFRYNCIMPNITDLYLLPTLDSDSPRIDWDKGEKYTLEFNVNGQI